MSQFILDCRHTNNCKHYLLCLLPTKRETVVKKSILAMAVLTLSTLAFADIAQNDGKAILELRGNDRIALAYADLGEGGEYNRLGGGAAATDMDVIKFPECGRNSRNKAVNALKVRAPKRKQHGNKAGQDNTGAYIQSISVIFDNGGVQKIDVRDRLHNSDSADGTRFYDLTGGNRCIRAIGIVGEESEANRRARSSQVEIIGRR